MSCRTRRLSISPGGRNERTFPDQLQIGSGLAIRAQAAEFEFRTVASDCAYGDQDGFRGEFEQPGLPFVMAMKPRRGT